jgi:hypothetical protein
VHWRTLRCRCSTVACMRHMCFAGTLFYFAVFFFIFPPVSVPIFLTFGIIYWKWSILSLQIRSYRCSITPELELQFALLAHLQISVLCLNQSWNRASPRYVIQVYYSAWTWVTVRTSRSFADFGIMFEPILEQDKSKICHRTDYFE